MWCRRTCQNSEHEEPTNVLRRYLVSSRDLDRQTTVNYKALRKVKIRDLWKQGPHIFDVHAATRRILVSSGKDHRLDIEYQTAQLPYTEANFEWLKNQMTKKYCTEYILHPGCTSDLRGHRSNREQTSLSTHQLLFTQNSAPRRTKSTSSFPLET